MFVHVALDGVADGPLGVGLDVIAAARRITLASRAGPPSDPRALTQRVVSMDGAPVVSGAGRPIPVDGALRLRALLRGDVLLVPGLSAVTEDAVRALLVRPDVAQLARAIARAREKGVTIAGSCSATFVLAASGVLAGHEATTTWWLAPVFRRTFPDVELTSDRMVVERDGVFSAGSAFAHADLVLAVLGKVAGPTLAHLVAKYLVLDERPSQAKYMIASHLRTDDPSVRAVERFVAQNLARRISLDELARVARTSPRTLARRLREALGATPTELVHRMRIARARHLLETTRCSVEEVAAQVGYVDPAAFRRIYRRYAGETPTASRLQGG